MRNTSKIEWDLALTEPYAAMYSKLSMEDVRKLQEAYLSMYQSFDAKCQELGLTAYMVAGTLIGALRHQGYIPWDDDIDLVMFREDFESLKEKLADDEDFELVDPSKSSQAIHNVLKIKSRSLTYYDVLGEGFSKKDYLYLDLLPIDFVSENSLVRRLKGTLFRALALSYASARCYDRYSPHLTYLARGSKELKQNLRIRKLVGSLAILVKPHRLFQLMEALLKGQKKTSKITIAYGVKGYQGEIVDFATFFPAQTYTFEGQEFYGPHDADRYLTNRYGDYMTPPDKEEQTERHIRLKDDWENFVEKQE